MIKLLLAFCILVALITYGGMKLVEHFECWRFGSLDFYPGITSHETRRIHTVTKEMTIEEIEEKLGYKIKIVNEKENQND